MGGNAAGSISWQIKPASLSTEESMFKKLVPGLCFCFAFVSFACANLAAQAPQIALAQRSPIIQFANGPDPGLTKIHSNLGSKTDAFDDGVSWSVTGPDNPRWGEGYLAMPFTPKANSTAKEILIALGFVTGGFNKGSISVFTSAHGAPGKSLKTWATGNFPPEGQCCKMISLKDSGISLQGGTQYWIVAHTGPHSKAQFQWNFVWNDALGKVAFLNGNTKDKWLPYHDNVAAFAVYGTVP
jgi:hypothetical protein